MAPFLINGQNMALSWPKHGYHMILQLGLSWILINVPRDIPCKISYCWVYPVAPFPRNDQHITLLWTSHGLHMVLKIDSSWILIIVPRDVPCQISHCWVYTVAPYPRNGQNMAFYSQNMVLTWSIELALPESKSMCPGMLHDKLINSGCIPWSPFLRNSQSMAL